MASSSSVAPPTSPPDGADPSGPPPFSLPAAARRSGRVPDRWVARLSAGPAVLFLLALFLFPLLWALVLSFSTYSATRNQPIEWVWFTNYVNVLTSPEMWQRAITTIVFVVAAVGLQTLAGFSIAYLLSRRVRGRGALTVLLLLPMMLSPVVVGAFWKLMLDAQFGVVNRILEAIGIGQVLWLTQPRLALFSLVIIDSWQWTPFIMVIALAGLTAVPRYLFEAAEIDRASEWFKFRHITLPLVWPLLLIAVLFRAIDAFRLFDIVYVVTGGGPGSSTETLSYHVYKIAFQNSDTAVASAYGILMVIVVTLATQVYVRYLTKVQAR